MHGRIISAGRACAYLHGNIIDAGRHCIYLHDTIFHKKRWSKYLHGGIIEAGRHRAYMHGHIIDTKRGRAYMHDGIIDAEFARVRAKTDFLGLESYAPLYNLSKFVWRNILYWRLRLSQSHYHCFVVMGYFQNIYLVSIAARIVIKSTSFISIAARIVIKWIIQIWNLLGRQMKRSLLIEPERLKVMSMKLSYSLIVPL